MARSNTILDYYNALELVNCCICHTCCKIRHCNYPKYWDRYIPEQTVHTQIRSSLIMVLTVWHLICILTCICMNWWNMLITFRQLCQYFFVSKYLWFKGWNRWSGITMKCPVHLWKTINKNIRNNILLKTEQDSSQAHHIKHQNQNLEDKHCRFKMRRLIMSRHIWICRVCRISYCFI